MLILSRKIGEQIKIGDDITLIVKAIKGNHIRLAIVAPREAKILRGELDRQTKGDNEDADLPQ